VEECLSVWLLPAPSLAATLDGHVRQIADAIGAPRFAAHLTLLGDVTIRRVVAEQALAGLAARLPLHLSPRPDLATSRHRFEALTVRFQPSAAFGQLAAELRARLGLPPAPAGDPHVSLAYPSPPFDPEALRPLAAGVPRDLPYRFEALALVDPGAGRDHWDEVAVWRISQRYPP
jgi:hypothetical protein